MPALSTTAFAKKTLHHQQNTSNQQPLPLSKDIPRTNANAAHYLYAFIGATIACNIPNHEPPPPPTFFCQLIHLPRHTLRTIDLPSTRHSAAPSPFRLQL